MSLELLDVVSGYGKKTVVHGVTMDVADREVVALVGPNGSGKSTLLNTIAGLLPSRRGRILWNGKDMTASSTAARVRDGISYAPQGIQIYRTLSVQENIELGSYILNDRQKTREGTELAFSLFPILKERRSYLASSLSGGERQMLAIGALLAAKPKCILLDEPSSGLAPMLLKRVFDAIETSARDLGVSVILVEQNVREAFRIANRAYIMSHGHIVAHGTPAELEDDGRLAERYFGTDGT